MAARPCASRYPCLRHIDSYETGWLAELERVLAPGGFAFLTIHCEHSWRMAATRPDLMRGLRKDPEFDRIYDANEPMPAGRLAFAWNRNSIEHNCNVSHHSNYVRRTWGKWLDVVEIRPLAHHGVQTVVLLQKRD